MRCDAATLARDPSSGVNLATSWLASATGFGASSLTLVRRELVNTSVNVPRETRKTRRAHKMLQKTGITGIKL